MKKKLTLVLIASAWLGCSAAHHPPIRTAPHVDLERFMGDWYVIANIPTSIEKDAYNAVESYQLDADGSIATTFTFRRGGFEGEAARYTPTGFVRDRTSNAVWGMQFVWPFEGDYRIVYVSDDYGVTVVGREKRDYVWIMARRPTLAEAEYQRLVSLVREQGYDTSRIHKVPQQWPETDRSR